MKHLNFKTVFLLALATANCRSEIHAWLTKNIRYQKDFTHVSLTPSARFIPKNCLVKEGPNSAAPGIVPALSPTLEESATTDRSLCPVRALQCYLDRTQELREGVIFVSFRQEFDKDISPPTISSWIKQTTILCYKLSDYEALQTH